MTTEPLDPLTAEDQVDPLVPVVRSRDAGEREETSRGPFVRPLTQPAKGTSGTESAPA